ncbi:hypothetical protein, partial [Shewanella sp. GutCb]|uniref:hypothetical protein n=1 Tax=Shewanella sp. GutCb TaxID=2058315 RepID=UPI001C60B04B
MSLKHKMFGTSDSTCVNCGGNLKRYVNVACIAFIPVFFVGHFFIRPQAVSLGLPASIVTGLLCVFISLRWKKRIRIFILGGEGENDSL